MNAHRYYSAVAIFEKRSEVWGVYAVTEPGRAEMKFPGGTSKDHLDADPIDTLDREIDEELHIGIRVAPCFFVEKRGLGHEKHFFLVLKYDGVIREGRFLDDYAEKMLRWVSLPEFSRNCLHHREAFRRALKAQAENSEEFKRETRQFVRSFQ